MRPSPFCRTTCSLPPLHWEKVIRPLLLCFLFCCPSQPTSPVSPSPCFPFARYCLEALGDHFFFSALWLPSSSKCPPLFLTIKQASPLLPLLTHPDFSARPSTPPSLKTGDQKSPKWGQVTSLLGRRGRVPPSSY